MVHKLLSIHEGLLAASRFRALARTHATISPIELIVLVVLGCCAALFSAFVDLPDLFGSVTGVYMKVPGNTIVRSFLPMALGLALVPRRLAATMIGACALVAGCTLNLTGKATIGSAAIASLGVTGPLLDIALWGAQNMWRLYGGFVLAGLASNLLAYAVRGLSKYHHEQHGSFSSVLLADWWSKAAASFTLCGLTVGLLCTMMWFRLPRVARSPHASPAA